MNNPNIIGNPINPFEQQYPDTCAIKSQQLILSDFGIHVTEDQLVQYSYEHGWYTGDGSGTLMGDIGNLLADAGIPCTQQIDANVFDLTKELAQGHKIIVGVDSSELHSSSLSSWLNDLFNGDTPDHALIVAGIDMTDPENPMVILTDPGTGEPAAPYPLDQFMDAWADSSHFMVSTDIPTPDAINAFQDMGDTYHLPDVAGVDYNTFNMFQNYSHNLPDPAMYPGMGDPMDMLYNAFNVMPTVPDMTFPDALSYVGLPPIDMTMPMYTPFDPTMYDYNNFGFDSSSTLSETTQHSIDVLQQSYDDCMRYAQDAMDNGQPVTPQLFINQAHDAQNAIDDILS